MPAEDGRCFDQYVARESCRCHEQARTSTVGTTSVLDETVCARGVPCEADEDRASRAVIVAGLVEDGTDVLKGELRQKRS